MQKQNYLAAIEEMGASLTAACRQDPGAGVTACPGWDVAGLAAHVGQVHRWAAGIVRSGTRGALGPAPDTADTEALCDWSADARNELLAALGEADPDAETWTFGPPRTVRFWLRRQAHETTLHAWDATAAAGHPVTIPAALAADGLAEFMDLMVPRIAAGAAAEWAGESVHLHATDVVAEWLVTLRPDGATVAPTHGKGDVALRAAAADLWLWAAGRVPPSAGEIFGDAALATRWTATMKFG